MPRPKNSARFLSCRLTWLNLSVLLGLLTGGFIVGCGAGQGASPGPSDYDFRRALLEEEASRMLREDAAIPESSIAHYNFLRGELALSDDKLDAALAYYQVAAKYEKRPAPLLRKRLAHLYVRSGDLEEALSELDLAKSISEDDVEYHQLRAGVLTSLRRIDDAVAVYRRLIDLTAPENEDAYILLASLHAQEGNGAAAEQVLDELVTQKPNSALGHYYSARIAESMGPYTRAEQHYRKAIELSPNPRGVELDFARSLGSQKRYEEALAICEKILSGEPSNVPARRLRGQLLLSNNQLDEALKEYEELRNLVADPVETRFKIALIKLERRDFAGAAVELNLILASDAAHPTARYYLGTAYAGQKDVANALRAFREVKQGDALFVESRMFAAYLLQGEKDLKGATEMLQEALKEKAESVRLRLQLATLYRESGDLPQAIAIMKEVIERDAENDRHHFTLGVFYDENDDKDEAVASMRRAVELNGKNASALNYLGYTYAELGTELEEAERLIVRALDIEPENGYYLDSLGWVYFKMGRYQDAAKELERAVGLVPNDAVIQEHYGRALLKLGQDRGALSAFRKALLNAESSDDSDVGERVKELIGELEPKVGLSTPVANEEKER